MMSLELIAIWRPPFQPDNDFDGRVQIFARSFFEELATVE